MASEEMPADAELVKGYDFNRGIDYHALLQSYRLSGFQATNFGKAVDEINRMVRLENCSNGSVESKELCDVRSSTYARNCFVECLVYTCVGGWLCTCVRIRIWRA